MTPSNPLADQLRQLHTGQLNAVLSFVACTSDGPQGVAGANRDRPARDSECKRVWINVNAGFSIDITGDIAQQVIAGLEQQAGTLDDDAEQLRAALAQGRFVACCG